MFQQNNIIFNPTKQFDMPKDVVIGVDIGGTYTKYGIIDKAGKIYSEDYISTNEYKTVKDFAVSLRKHLFTSLENNLPEFNLKGIGIGAPNGNYYTGKIEFAPNLNWKGVIELVKIIEKEFNLPAVLTNDANAAALGEMLFGDAKNMQNFIMITLGTGLGSGLVINGQLVYGHDGFAGELGHVRAVDNGRQCGCGKKGCLETYVSATGIKRTIFELLADENVNSEFRKISFNKLKPKLITSLAEKGDPIAIKAFEKTGFLLGRNLADTVAHLSPQAIFLFGGLAKSGKWIIEPTKKSMEEHLLAIYKNKIDIRPSALLKKNIAVLGAAALIWKELEDQS